MIVATSDLHGNLPETPECDVLIIAGDVCPMYDHHPDVQLGWLDTNFRNWLTAQPAKHIIGIAGNHDFVFEHRSRVESLFLPWRYLLDESLELDGVKYYGTPWVPNLAGWAFYGTSEKLREVYDAIPADTDVVISHDPPKGFCDQMANSVHIGSKTGRAMLDRVKPKAYVCGHIHEGFGQFQHNQTTIYNVAYVDEFYAVRGQFVEIKLDRKINLKDGMTGVG
jgi:Icc-related predicted phosphoesterase